MLCYRSLIYDAASADSLATDSTGEPYGRAQPSEARQSKMQVSDCVDTALTCARQGALALSLDRRGIEKERAKESAIR